MHYPRSSRAHSQEQKKPTKEKYMGKLDGKTALITGGDSGIGLTTAKQFVNEGAHLFIAGRRDSELAAAVEEIGMNVIGVQGEVSNPSDLDRLFAQIKRERGKLDIVFASAAAANLVPLGTMAEQDQHSNFDINVKGLFFTVEKALPLLPDGASIIILSTAPKGAGAYSPDSVTAIAVHSFGRTWAKELKGRRIRVNVVNPGPIDARLNGALGSGEAGEHRLIMTSNRAPLRRVGTVEEVAEAVVFLASDDSAHITGTNLFVGGNSFSDNVPLGRLGTPDEVAKAVVFLASDDSSRITGTELFVGAGFSEL